MSVRDLALPFETLEWGDSTSSEAGEPVGEAGHPSHSCRTLLGWIKDIWLLSHPSPGTPASSLSVSTPRWAPLWGDVEHGTDGTLGLTSGRWL